jgi:hypothetical protein
VEVELLVGVDIVPYPGQQDQVEEPLGHLLLQVRREDSCRLHQQGKYIAHNVRIPDNLLWIRIRRRSMTLINKRLNSKSFSAQYFLKVLYIISQI